MSQVIQDVEYSKVGNKVHPLKDQRSGQFTITWKDIKYVVKTSGGQRLVGRCMGQKNMWKTKTILNGISGQLKSGHLMGLMGASGAGKSTLLECIVGRRVKGRTGEIVCDSHNPLKLSFVPQTDVFFDVLTVREALTFASTVLNSTLAFREKSAKTGNGSTAKGGEDMTSNAFNKENVDRLLALLGLEICADNRTSNCSGGQLKRLSIAQELAGKPNVLVLDEPTSGLDSSTCQLVIELFRKLTEDKINPMTILLTIHQPSYKILCMFHKIYILGSRGKCIYDGAPTQIVNELDNNGLMCPDDVNPADFVMEVASGEYGVEIMNRMAYNQNNGLMSQMHGLRTIRPLDELILAEKFPEGAHFWPLVWRSFKATLRDPWLFGLRLMSQVIFGFVMGAVLKDGIGQKGGCPPDFDADFDPSELEAMQISNRLETDATFDNSGNFIMAFVVLVFTGILPMAITFPLEMHTFIKEKRNQWYSVRNYYLAKTVADVPFQILFPVIYVGITYTVGNQVHDVSRFLNYLLINVLVSCAAQSHGLLLGATFMRYIAVGVYLAPITSIPTFIFAGYFLKMSTIPAYFMPLADLSYIRYGFETTLGAMYGYDRCGVGIEGKLLEAHESLTEWMHSMLGSGKNGTTGVPDSFTKDVVKLIAGEFVGEDGRVRSSILNFYEIKDESIVPGIAKICAVTIVLRVWAYYVVVKKANAKG